MPSLGQLSFLTIISIALYASFADAKYRTVSVALGSLSRRVTTFNRIAMAAKPKPVWMQSTNWSGTIFVPEETAWGDLMLGWSMTITQLLKRPDLCAAIANYHTIPVVDLRKVNFPTSSMAPLTVPTLLSKQALSLSSIVNGAQRTVYMVTGAFNAAALTSVNDLGTAKGILHVISKALVPQGLVGVSPPPALPQPPTIYAWLADQSEYSSIFKVVSSTVEALTLLSTQPKHLNLTFLIPSNKAVAALAASRNVTVDQIVNQVANNITSAELTVASLTLTRPYVLSNTPDLTNLLTRAAGRTIVERNVNGVVTLQTPLSRANIVNGPIYFGPSIVYVIDSVLYF